MADIWFISDTHFFHENILTFKDSDGKLIRPEFSNVSEMNDFMVTKWNETVKPQDKVYHLGDVAVGVKDTNALERLIRSLHGHKRLLLGNHDHIDYPGYQHFEKIELWTGGKFKQYNFVASHIPLRESTMRDGEFNVHGHLHQNVVTAGYWDYVSDDGWFHKPSLHHINVCVEHTNYTPVHLDEIVARVK
jgi:calcineurin-like phosphoesterase family protein